LFCHPGVSPHPVGAGVGGEHFPHTTQLFAGLLYVWPPVHALAGTKAPFAHHPSLAQTLQLFPKLFCHPGVSPHLVGAGVDGVHFPHTTQFFAGLLHVSPPVHALAGTKAPSAHHPSLA